MKNSTLQKWTWTEVFKKSQLTDSKTLIFQACYADIRISFLLFFSFVFQNVANQNVSNSLPSNSPTRLKETVTPAGLQQTGLTCQDGSVKPKTVCGLRPGAPVNPLTVWALKEGQPRSPKGGKKFSRRCKYVNKLWLSWRAIMLTFRWRQKTMPMST